jgi:hypothetical protein
MNREASPTAVRCARSIVAAVAELAAAIAKHSRPRTQAVASYDLTFSPVKSVSALWAVADLETGGLVRGELPNLHGKSGVNRERYVSPGLQTSCD